MPALHWQSDEVFAAGDAMNDFRIRGMAHLRAIIEEGKSAIETYVRAGLPPDRKGLIAVYHPLLEYTGRFLEQVSDVAKLIAMEQQQTVFVVMTETRWRLLLFGFQTPDDRLENFGLEPGAEHIWYDDYEDGKFANDQFVGHYAPDGSWHVDSIS